MGTEITPELIQALVSMGALDEQDANLGQQLKGVQSYAQPMGNPYAHAEGAAAPVGALMYGLADVLRSGIGAYKERGIRQKQDENIASRTKSRDLYAQELIDALRGGGNPDPQMLAAALRKQQMLGLLGQLSGDRVLSPVGQSVGRQAAHTQDTLVEQQQQGPQRAMRLALGQQALAKAERADAAAKDPGAVTLKRTLAAKWGGGMNTDDVSADALDPLLPLLERANAADQSAAARKDAAAAQRAERGLRAQERKDALDLRTSEKESQLADKQFIALGDAVNLARGRQGEAGKAMGTIQQAKRDLQLIEQNPNPSEQQLYEIARGLDRVISGAAPTIGATEHLVPETLRGKLANFQQWVTNKPTGAEKQEFVRQYKETLERIAEATRGFVDETNAKTFNSRSHLAKRDPERWNAAITAAGLSPDDFDQKTWVYRGKPKGGGPVRIQSDAEYEALPSGTVFVDPEGVTRTKP